MSERPTVRKKSGKPNRGGGRFNKVGSRRGGKSNFSSLGYSRKAAQSVFDDDFNVCESFSPEKYKNQPKSVKRKVTLQKLTISVENCRLIEEVLRNAQKDFAPNTEFVDHKPPERNLNHNYWVLDNKLQIQDICNFSQSDLNPFNCLEKINKYSIEKLSRYGFDQDECMKALEVNDWEVGKALEHLLQNCIKTYVVKNDCDSIFQISEEEKQNVLEQREDEKTALQSIFGNAFIERIPNRVWVINLNLPFLKEMATSHLQVDRHDSESSLHHSIRPTRNASKSKQQSVSSRFQDKKNGQKFLQFDKRGKGKDVAHQILKQASPKDEEADAAPGVHFELEVRFPVNNYYPYEAPLVCFCSHSSSLPLALTFHITVLLLKEAFQQAKTHNPVVHTLICLLEDKNNIEPLLFAKPLSLSLPVKDETSKTIQPSLHSEATIREAILGTKSFSSEVKQIHILKPKVMDQDTILPEQSSKDNQKLKKLFRLKIQSSARYQERLAMRTELPAWEAQNQVLKVIENSQVSVISGLTGCGKTTQIPQFILDKWLTDETESPCFIMCTQPRRISAISVATRVAEERCEKLGEMVGYQIRLESVQSSHTRILYCTTGILLRRLEGSCDLSGITHILLDEVHERSKESDFLLMVLRKILPNQPNLKVVLMSATLDAELFSEYFGNCPVVEIPGKMFPVHQLFLEDILEMTGYAVEQDSVYCKQQPSKLVKSSYGFPITNEELDLDLEELSLETKISKVPKDCVPDDKLTFRQLSLRYAGYSKAALKALFKMDMEKINNDLIVSALEWIVNGKHEHSQEGAILIFLPGMAEITKLFEHLKTHALFGFRGKRFVIFPLHSLLSTEEQNAVFSQLKGKRKIILSTNIAETSVTIDDVVFVIDSGRIKENCYDPAKGMESLDTVWESRANAIQRKGRAGRVKPGLCIHLFTSFHFGHMRPQPVPEIQRVPLESLILLLKMLSLFATSAVQDVLTTILEPPSQECIDDAIHRLQELGALDVKENLTALGYHLSALPVDVRIGKLMLYGSVFQCLDSALTIAACLSYKSPFKSSFGSFEETDKKRMEFMCHKSDQLAALKAYKGWQKATSAGNSAQYCYDNNLSLSTLMMLASMKHQFLELLSSMKFAPQGLTARSLERQTRGKGDNVLKVTGAQFNKNGDNERLLLSVLCAALYPNVLQILTPAIRYAQGSSGSIQKQPKPLELRFKTKEGDYVFIHPSSLNFHISHYESPYLVFHEKVKTSKVYVRGCSMVYPHALLLFGGSQLAIELHGGDFVISLDGWMHVKAPSHHVAVLIKELRFQVDRLMVNKIEDPSTDLNSSLQGQQIIDAIVHLLSTE